MTSVHPRGQILVLFAGGLIALLAMAALAIDLSSVYSTQQTEKAATDAASLAGAQQLRAIGDQPPDVRKSARDVAWATLLGRFGIAGSPACNTSADDVDCPLGASGYHAFISTPAKSTPTNRQSLQVTLSHPNFQLSFSRLLGQNGWNVSRSSVAVNDRKHQYAVVTLQPPAQKPRSGEDANLCDDIVVSGTGTLLNVLHGDIGTNTSAATTLSGHITLEDGYVIDHIDDISFGGCSVTTPGATWTTDAAGLPRGNYIGPAPLIQDRSDYPIAQFTGAPTFVDQDDVLAVAATGVTACAALPGFPTDSATVTMLTPPSGGTLRCYRPGIYSGKFSLTSNKDIAYLLPGAYEFLGGMKLGGLLGGGMTTGMGVVLVFPQTTTLDPNNAVGVFLNSGAIGCTAGVCRSAPARDFVGTEMKTPEGLTLTIEVPRQESCFSGTNPQPTSECNTPPNGTISLGGGGKLTVAGVVYAPSDNVTVAGNSDAAGYVGQVLAWTVKYSGHGTLNQEYPATLGNGVLRLDRACSGGNTACIP